MPTAVTLNSTLSHSTTDSAPHTRAAKESECGCAGIYSAPIALEAYAEAFNRHDIDAIMSAMTEDTVFIPSSDARIEG